MATVEFHGESFALREKVPEYALGKFASAAAAGVDGDSMQGIAAMMNLVQKCIAEDDWARFDRCADKNDASFEDLTKVIQSAMEQAAERPTGRSSDSSDGPVSIAPKSVSSVDVSDLESLLAGRPDKQLAVVRTRAG